jgi:hypothetical protein
VVHLEIQSAVRLKRIVPGFARKLGVGVFKIATSAGQAIELNQRARKIGQKEKTRHDVWAQQRHSVEGPARIRRSPRQVSLRTHLMAHPTHSWRILGLVYPKGKRD